MKASLKRPSQSVPGLDLSDHIEIVLLIGPETLRSNDGLIIWLRDTAIDIVDSGPEPRLKFVYATSEEADLVDEDALLTRLAQDLKGKRWDADKGAWQ